LSRATAGSRASRPQSSISVAQAKAAVRIVLRSRGAKSRAYQLSESGGAAFAA
jgi:hypothetical protein